MLDLTPIKAKPRGAVYPFVFEANEVEQHWELLEPFIERSIRFSFGTLTAGGIKNMLLNNSAVCMGIAENGMPLAILVITIVCYPERKAARVIAAAGSKLKEAMRFFHILEAWAYTQGAVEIEAWCRPAMVRLVKRFGFRERLVMCTLDITRTLQ